MARPAHRVLEREHQRRDRALPRDQRSLAHQARCRPTQGLRVLPSTGQSAPDLATRRSRAGNHDRCPCRFRRTRRTGRAPPRERVSHRTAGHDDSGTRARNMPTSAVNKGPERLTAEHAAHPPPATQSSCSRGLSASSPATVGGLRGCSSMVEHQLPKLRTRVRFPSSAPFPLLDGLPKLLPFSAFRPG